MAAPPASAKSVLRVPTNNDDYLFLERVSNHDINAVYGKPFLPNPANICGEKNIAQTAINSSKLTKIVRLPLTHHETNSYTRRRSAAVVHVESSNLDLTNESD